MKIIRTVHQIYKNNAISIISSNRRSQEFRQDTKKPTKSRNFVRGFSDGVIFELSERELQNNFEMWNTCENGIITNKNKTKVMMMREE